MTRWSKILSTTDAQQQTTGGIVPYLRLTSHGLRNGNFQTWFRQTFFNGCHWRPSLFNNKPVEEAIVPFQVIIQGQIVGNINFTVTHDQSRQYNNNAPNTWLHWPPQISILLQATNYSGHQIVLTRNNQNAFTLEIN